MIKIFIKKIKKLLKIKFLFNFPTKKKILLYDESNVKILKDIIRKDFNLIKIREIEIYFWIFIKQIFFLDFSYTTYCKNFISYTSPKVVISINDSKVRFFEMKKKFKNINFISMQSGGRYPTNFKNKEFLNKNFYCDHFFVFNEYYIKQYKKIINSNFHVLGAYRNNIVEVKKSSNKNFLLISEYDKDGRDKKVIKSFCKLLELLNIYFSRSNKKIHILLRRKNSTQKEEMEFYNKYFKSNCVFHNIFDWKKSYQTVDKFENIIFMQSTLGYEATARKKKVACFQTNLTGSKFWFGWPKPFQKKHYFFTSKNLSYSEVKRILTNLNYCSQSTWEKKYYNSIKDLVFMDKNNEKFREILSKILKNSI
tara:strand:+ start:245 stop:1342 length:1098 start_codon:yes stop_codon:yes gene_type:complete